MTLSSQLPANANASRRAFIGHEGSAPARGKMNYDGYFSGFRGFAEGVRYLPTYRAISLAMASRTALPEGSVFLPTYVRSRDPPPARDGRFSMCVRRVPLPPSDPPPARNGGLTLGAREGDPLTLPSKC
jgi:hypothetical protein